MKPSEKNINELTKEEFNTVFDVKMNERLTKKLQTVSKQEFLQTLMQKGILQPVKFFEFIQ